MQLENKSDSIEPCQPNKSIVRLYLKMLIWAGKSTSCFRKI